MMELVSSWLTGVVAVSLLLFLLRELLPEGTLRGIGEFTGGLVLLAALLQPLKGMVPDEMVAEAFSWQRQIYQTQKELEKEQTQAFSEGIAQTTASYIWDKAEKMGLQLHAEVETKVEEGIPLPWTVTLRGEYSAEIASWIEGELGIPRERQVWHEGENGD